MAAMRYYGNIMTTIWRLRVTMETSNNMAAMRYYGNVMTTKQYGGYALLWNRYDRMVDGGSTPPYNIVQM